jgi:hypothetical protein
MGCSVCSGSYLLLGGSLGGAGIRGRKGDRRSRGRAVRRLGGDTAAAGIGGHGEGDGDGGRRRGEGMKEVPYIEKQEVGGDSGYVGLVLVENQTLSQKR